jgi:DNA-binding transcriptional LysR family regulator
MDVESLKHFYFVARGNTFLNAAEQCNISQSSLSKSIQRLESELGVALLDRRQRSAKLTPAGECLFNDLRKLAPAFGTMMSNMQAFSERRKISCCTVPNISGFSTILSVFTKKNPNISVNLRTERDYRRALAQLANGELDFVLLHEPLASQDQCSFTFLFADRLQALLPLNHALASRQAIRFPELMKMPIALDVYMSPNIQDAAARMGLKPNIQVTDLKREDIILHISAGNGVSLYYESDLRQFKLNRVAVCFVEEFPDQPFVLAHSKKMKMSFEHLLFKEHMAASFSEAFC